jgi:polar amino acid transport system substrate-binding protein
MMHGCLIIDYCKLAVKGIYSVYTQSQTYTVSTVNANAKKLNYSLLNIIWTTMINKLEGRLHPGKPISLFLLAIFLFLVQGSSRAEELLFVSDPYCPHVCDKQPGDQGYVTEVVREIFSAEGFEVGLVTMPWSRAISYFGSANEENIRYHGVLLSDPYVSHSSLRLSPQVTHNKIALTNTKSCIYRRTGFDWQFEGLESKAVRLGVIQDYGYPESTKQFIELMQQTYPIHRVVGDNPTKNALHRLLGKRFDIILMDPNIANYHINNNGWKSFIETTECTGTERRFYIGFSSAFHLSEKLIQILDRGLLRLEKNGRLNFWRAKYHISDNPYELNYDLLDKHFEH